MASISHHFQLPNADAESLFTAGVLMKPTSMFIGVALLQRPILYQSSALPFWRSPVFVLIIRAASAPDVSFLLPVFFFTFCSQSDTDFQVSTLHLCQDDLLQKNSERQVLAVQQEITHLFNPLIAVAAFASLKFATWIKTNHSGNPTAS